MEKSRIREFEAIGREPLSTKFAATFDSQFQATVPQYIGERNPKLFELARLLKSLPQFKAAEDCEAVVREWHRLALPHISTKDWETSWTDFLYGFEQVKYPLGTGRLENIMKTIPSTVPDKMLPSKARQYESQDTRRLVLLCRELQRENGVEPFYLSGKKAVELLGLSDDVVQRKRFFRLMGTLLVHDGILKIVQRGTARTATRYLYIGDQAAAGAALKVDP